MFAFRYNLPVLGSVFYSHFDICYTISILLAILTLNFLVFIRLWYRKKTISIFVSNANSYQSNAKPPQERAHFAQFFVITTFPMMSSITNNFLPIFNLDVTIIAIIGMIISLMYWSSNGIIYLFANQTVKKEFKKIARPLLKCLNVP